jgi:hypothetical protein
VLSGVEGIQGIVSRETWNEGSKGSEESLVAEDKLRVEGDPDEESCSWNLWL